MEKIPDEVRKQIEEEAKKVALKQFITPIQGMRQPHLLDRFEKVYIEGVTASYKALSDANKKISSAEFELGNALAVSGGYDWETGDPGDVIMRMEKYILKAKQLLLTQDKKNVK